MRKTKLDQKTSPNKLIAIKKFCAENDISVRIFIAEANRQKIKIKKIKSSFTDKQTANCTTLHNAEKILASFNSSKKIKPSERTLAELAKRFKLEVHTLRMRLKYHKIEGRMVRFWSNTRNYHKKNQTTLAYKVSVVEKLFK